MPIDIILYGSSRADRRQCGVGTVLIYTLTVSSNKYHYWSRCVILRNAVKDLFFDCILCMEHALTCACQTAWGKHCHVAPSQLS